MTDYDKLLGVTKESNQSEIKKAYRKQAVKHYPDKGGDPEEFKTMQSQWDTIKDDVQKRYTDLTPSGSKRRRKRVKGKSKGKLRKISKMKKDKIY